MKLLDHIQDLRKAQLQEYFVRWFPSEKMVSDREQLVERLHLAMRDPTRIRERFDRLTRSAQDFLVALLTHAGHRGTVEQIRQSPRGRSIEPYEVETLVKQLTTEGWVVPVSETSNGTRLEVYVLPEEIADGLGSTVDVECRDAAVMLSLAAFLRSEGAKDETASGNGTTLKTLTGIQSVKKRIAEIADAGLRDIIRYALDEHGGILPLSAWRAHAERPAEHLHRDDWRHELESKRLGTTGVLSLKGYGIDLEEECLVVFQEIVQAHCGHQLATAKVENDAEYRIGVDLLIDIRRVLEVARSEALEVTRDGTVFKKTEERLESQLLTSQYRELFEGSSLQHILALCKRLRLLDQGDRYMRPDPIRRRLWMKKRLPAMVRNIFEIYHRDYRGSRWSFHQRVIRDLFLAAVERLPAGRWVQARELFTLVIAEFLASLHEAGVAATFRELQTEEFHNEALMVPLDRLRQGLSFWAFHRLALAGLLNIGMRAGKFHAVQISSLARRVLKIEGRAGDDASAGRGKLVVNPDFEILLFPGGRRFEQCNYLLAAFADRTGSDRVKRYRLTPESVKRGVIAGYSAGNILEFLESHSETPIPSNVTFSIREWAEGIEPVLRQRVLLLKAKTPPGTDRLTQLLVEHEIPHERVGKTAVVVRGVKNERRIRELQEIFHNAGLIME